MGPPISPFIANLFMEEFKVKALSSSPHPPWLWIRYVDDTFVIQEAKHSQQLLQHIYSQDPHIQFTVEEPNQEGALPFLDTLISPGPTSRLVTTVYRKPKHTDQYLHWDSNHFITAKKHLQHLSIQAKVVCTSQQALQKEMEHTNKALLARNFTQWAINILHNKFNHKHNSHNEHTNNSTTQQTDNNNSGSNNKNISIVVPYIHGLRERFKRTCINLGIQVDFRGTNTIKILLMSPPRIGTTNYRKVVLYIGLNAHKNQLAREVQRGIRQILWGLAQGTSQGSIPYTPTQSTPQDTQ